MTTSRSHSLPRAALTLLTRPGCGLCEELRAELEAGFPDRFEIREVCVDDRPEWRERYGTLVPVLLDPAGAVLCQSRFDPAAVRDWLGNRGALRAGAP